MGWACGLYSDLIGHWSKRNPDALEEVNPANLNQELLADFFHRYGSQSMIDTLDQLPRSETFQATAPDQRDDFGPCGIEQPEDIRDLFIPNFYFGCEADDPVNAWAFNKGVEDGVITEDDFQDFVFGNPIRLWTSMNTDFFSGTAVETQVQQFLTETNGA